MKGLMNTQQRERTYLWVRCAGKPEVASARGQGIEVLLRRYRPLRKPREARLNPRRAHNIRNLDGWTRTSWTAWPDGLCPITLQKDCLEEHCWSAKPHANCTAGEPR